MRSSISTPERRAESETDASSGVATLIHLPGRQALRFLLTGILLTEAGVEQCPIGERFVVNLAHFEEPVSVLLHELVLVVSEVDELYVLLRCVVRDLEPVG